uniref:Thioredoxin domain-containing protein n=1 Tax=Pseudo-nitzschia delicatissima TaxID=44447 RepID=A0A7S0TCE2_9STRA|mmetsp:Transcript_752/g.1723  ORF Transcript_752/g.1723 Transcript_752/m.1723 type:complete len:289 (+) Transcript_752:136-1002(+)
MFRTARHLQRGIAARSVQPLTSPLTRGNALLVRKSPMRIRLMTSEAKKDVSSAAAAKTRAGSGKVASSAPYIKDRGPVSWPSLFLVGIAAASVVAYYNIERERRLESAMGRVVSTGKPAIGGPWSLIDLDGNLVTNVSFQGKWLLLYFGFARCPDICPSEMMKLARVIDQLKETHPQLASKLVPVFVSVDPARDSLTALREYAKDFHPDFVFLTGSPTQVQEMAKKYRVYVSKAEETDDGDYLVDHSIVVYFHDDKGELSDCFTQSMRPKDVAEKIVDKMTSPEGLVA